MTQSQNLTTIEKKALVIYPLTPTTSPFFDSIVAPLIESLEKIGVSSERATTSEVVIPSVSTLVDWEDPLSLENAAVGFNWILLFFPFIHTYAHFPLTNILGHPPVDPKIHKYAKCLRELIEAMVRVSGQSTRLLVLLEPSPTEYFPQSSLEMERSVPAYAQPLVDISSIYRSQGFPVSICVPTSSSSYLNLLKGTIDRLTNKREFPFLSYVS